MNCANSVGVVIGGASGLGMATTTARRLVAQGLTVVIADLPTSQGAAVAAWLGARVHVVAADVAVGRQI